MSDDRTHTQTSPADDENGDSEFESWLRKAARVPDVHPGVLLPQSGQVVGGKYRIEEPLGRGGMGAVYRATHVVSDKQVAVKWMLRPASDERARQRFTREARAAGRIDHPNVVDVYDIGQEGEAGYLVMELLRGESLRSCLARGPLRPTVAVDLLLPAMRGVAAAHREGVIHRDLKPDNIFLCRSPDGEARQAKVLDFGISSLTALEDDARTTLTKDGAVLGTPAYMSPEQLQSARNADARADVYAFGVILYEALTGGVPFSADSHNALVLAVANTAPRRPRELAPEIPPALERVVLHAIEKDREQRVSSMAALIAALEPFASVKSAGLGEHVSIDREPVLPHQKRRHVRWTAGALMLIALLSAIAWWVTDTRAPSAATPAADAPSSRAPIAESEAVGAESTSRAVAHSTAASNQPQTQAGASARRGAAGTTATANEPAVGARAIMRKPRHREVATETATPQPATSAVVPGPAVDEPRQGRAGVIRLDEL